ncbi:MAG TPA: bifunctional lysylphosphatidylglycerol synthetase/lysine--tRNA ligase LysX [Actinokineospora sp.]|nr:bifunctional lysylphosphatidylglycerol synthetase/lysine--tRNA ligase LysX [Actinokineospora sp.]
MTTSSAGVETVHKGWVPRVFAWVLTAVAVLCALAAVSAAVRRGSQPVRETVDAWLIPAPANLAYAAFLALLAGAVARRKRAAYWILIGYFGLQLLAEIMVGVLLVLTPGLIDDGEPWQPVALGVNALITVVALGVLIRARGQFYARVQHGSVRKAVGTFVVLAGVAIAIGFALSNRFPGTLQGVAEQVAWSADRVLGGLVGFDAAHAERGPGPVGLLLGFMGAVALLGAVLTLFRSQRTAARLTADDERRVRELLVAHGDRDSLGYFATRRDKSVVFSGSGKAAITYRVIGGVCLASGDPIGDPESWPPAIDSWLTMVREYAWTPAVMGAGERGANAFAKAGLKVLELGDEAIVDVAAFSLDGREMRPVRQAVNRLERSGHTTRIRRHDTIPQSDMDIAVRLAHEWRDTESERGFSMALGRLGDPADGECVLVEALDTAGTPVALLSFSPWGAHGLSLDLMRRDRASDNGLVEFMVTALVAAAPGLGVERVSLNFAVFRAVFEEGAQIGAGPVLIAWRRTLLFFSRWWQLESLYRANVKYRPRWVPRYLCFGELRDLVKVGLASAAAEGFLTLPWRKSELPVAIDPALVLPSAAVVAEAAPAERAVTEQTRVRLAKVDQIRAAGGDPYPVSFARTHTFAAVKAAHHGLAPDTRTGAEVAVAGRVLRMRDHGGLSFATLRDGTGEIQILVSAERTARQADWRALIDIGDHVGVTGEVITTRRGELTVLAADWTMTAKCLRPLPDKHRGLSDPEARVRNRALDLITNPAAGRMLRARADAVAALRDTLRGEGYIEVETPILQQVHGGANARPFTTHINVYDLDLYLRIAPELYLKRLCVGGVEKVFELGRTFRNEGVSYKHNPEFTMLEAYQSYADYTTMRIMTENLVRAAATAVHGSPVLLRDNEKIDISGDWPVVSVNEAISTALGEAITSGTSESDLRRFASRAGVRLDPGWNRGQVVLELYEQLAERTTTVPTFYTDFPTEVSPLTRQHRTDPALAERWDLVAFGTELGTAYSELIDPVEQRRRLTAQSLLAAGGDPEAMELDEDFLSTLEFAMPPTGGLGLGVDRLMMLLTGMSLRDTVAFPMTRMVPHRQH